MGGKSSKEETQQNIHANGQINNNIIIYDQVSISNKQATFILYALLVLNILQLLYIILKDKYRKVKNILQCNYTANKV